MRNHTNVIFLRRGWIGGTTDYFMFIGLFVPLISDNVPTTNLAESVHSTWKTTQAITLVDDAYHDIAVENSGLGSPL